MFGLLKVGKTTLLSNLPRCLIVDMEDGTDYVEALSIKAKTYVDLFNIAKELITRRTKDGNQRQN